MYNHNDHKCLVCGDTFYYCRSCRIKPIKHLAEGFCSETCADIFAILSRHGCNLITADEALTELSAYNINEITLTKDILAHVEKIKSEVSVKVKEPMVVEESTPIEESTVQYNNQKNQKKW